MLISQKSLSIKLCIPIQIDCFIKNCYELDLLNLTEITRLIRPAHRKNQRLSRIGYAIQKNVLIDTALELWLLTL